MGRRLLAAVAAVVFVVLVPAGSVGADAGRPFATTLTGAAEVPAADPDASGSASIILNQGLGTVCFDLSWANVDGTVFAAHIHLAPVGVNGPIVVPLFAGSFAGTDSLSGCVEGVDRDLIKAIRQDPSAYYVNVHSTPDFPGGAIRGQLGK
ncbi:MAG TPA: CHRD domain-containing protein [Actinomycetota bacterium]